MELKPLHPSMKRIPRTWLRLAFYLHNKSNVEHVFLSLFPHIWTLQAFFITTIASSEENNFFRSSFVQFLFFWQKSIRVFLLAGLIKLFFFNTLFSGPISAPVISNSNLRKFLNSVIWLNSEQMSFSFSISRGVIEDLFPVLTAAVFCFLIPCFIQNQYFGTF